MIPQRLDPAANRVTVCEFALKWRVSLELAEKLFTLARILPFQVQMVSGYRTAREQEAEKDGAPVALSNHTSCPATAADLQIIGWNKTNTPHEVRRAFGGAVQVAGMRWGGGSEVVDGIPNDWNHVDLGKRVQ